MQVCGVNASICRLVLVLGGLGRVASKAQASNKYLQAPIQMGESLPFFLAYLHAP